MEPEFTSIETFISELTSVLSQKNVCLVLRAIPGSGKSYVTKQLKETLGNKYSVVSVSADDYFVDPATGVYKFDIEKIGNAHGHSRYCFDKAQETKTNVVIVDNTNLKSRDWKYYKNVSVEKGYAVYVLNVVCDAQVAFKRQTHGVPASTHEAMANLFNIGLKTPSNDENVTTRNIKNG